jgi:hypothetical protein
LLTQKTRLPRLDRSAYVGWVGKSLVECMEEIAIWAFVPGFTGQ